MPPKPPAAKRAAAPASAQPAAEAGAFRIQFGAFAVEDNANQTKWTVEATGLPVEVVHAPSRKGHMLYYVRSQPFPDRAAALSAATTARDKAHNLPHPAKIDFVVMSDAMITAEQKPATKP
jgi:cell division septation protein DedD